MRSRSLFDFSQHAIKESLCMRLTKGKARYLETDHTIYFQKGFVSSRGSCFFCCFERRKCLFFQDLSWWRDLPPLEIKKSASSSGRNKNVMRLREYLSIVFPWDSEVIPTKTLLQLPLFWKQRILKRVREQQLTRDHFSTFGRDSKAASKM